MKRGPQNFQPAKMYQARIKANLSLEEVAERLKVKTPSVWRWEKGKCLPKAARLKMLASVLGVPVEYLYSEAK